MKKLPNVILLKFVLIGSLFLFFSCKEKHKIPDCKEARKSAKVDFAKKKYIYFEYQYLTHDKSGNEEFKNILKKRNIKVIFKTKYPISCMPDDKSELEKSEDCYCMQMNLCIEAKFGHKFLDSVRTESKKAGSSLKYRNN